MSKNLSTRCNVDKNTVESENLYDTRVFVCVQNFEINVFLSPGENTDDSWYASPALIVLSPIASHYDYYDKLFTDVRALDQ